MYMRIYFGCGVNEDRIRANVEQRKAQSELADMGWQALFNRDRQEAEERKKQAQKDFDDYYKRMDEVVKELEEEYGEFYLLYLDSKTMKVPPLTKKLASGLKKISTYIPDSILREIRNRMKKLSNSEKADILSPYYDDINENDSDKVAGEKFKKVVYEQLNYVLRKYEAEQEDFMSEYQTYNPDYGN
jgi:hypothetical protein